MKKGAFKLFGVAVGIAAVAFATVLSASAQSILINIDSYTPSAVTFTATGNFATANDSTELNLFGVDLVSYFTASIPTSGSSITGTLIPAGTTAAYNNWFTDNYLNGANNVDVNLFTSGNIQLQQFTTSSAAFTGVATVNLSSFLAELPTTGTTGFIYSGYSRSPGNIIGMWQVVPEPSSLAQLVLGGISLAGMLVWRSRRPSLRS